MFVSNMLNIHAKCYALSKISNSTLACESFCQIKCKN